MTFPRVLRALPRRRRLPVLLGALALTGLALGWSASGAVAGPGPASGAGPGGDARGGSPEHYRMALFGDMPYGAKGRREYPALIDDGRCAWSAHRRRTSRTSVGPTGR